MDTQNEVEKRSKKSSKQDLFERETTINFNDGEDTCYIYTCNKKWQTHLEKKLGLVATQDNGFGGKFYEISKKRISLPRAPRKTKEISSEMRAKIGARLQKTLNLRSKNKVITVESEDQEVKMV